MPTHPPLPLASRPNRFWLAALLQLGLVLNASAQIRTDSSLGLAAQTLVGPAYTIPQSIGRLAGSNLFHSFEAFTVLSGQSANFTTSTPGLANVISRVTGGTLSQINGQLKLTPVSGTPNFFFINPAGIAFGAGASIDVPAAFHVSTANSVKFAGGNFSADLGQTSTFSSAAPQAFGFHGTTRAPITVKDGATLSLPGSQSISLVAGDMDLNNGRIASAAGDIRIAALGQKAQEFAFSGSLAAGSGNLSIRNGGSVSSSTSSSDNAGSVKVSAGNITIDRQGNAAFTGIASLANAGSGNAGTVEVAAGDILSILNGGQIASDTYSSGKGGVVKVSAASISVDGQAGSTITGITSEARAGTGNAGSIEVTTAGALSLVDGSRISSSTYTPGNAGSIKINAGDVVLDGHGRGLRFGQGLDSAVTGILSAALFTGSGNASSVELTASGKLSVLASGGVFASGKGATSAGGSIKVNATNILLDGQGSDFIPTGMSADSGSGSGNAGTIELTTPGTMTMHTSGIGTSNFGSGMGGGVKVHAGNLVMDGTDDFYASTAIAAITCKCVRLNPTNAGTGNGGTIDVTVADSLMILNTARITADTISAGNAGSIKVSVGNIVLDGGVYYAIASTGILSRALEGGSTGNGGSIEVHATRGIEMRTGGNISTEGRGGPGSGGTIKVSAGNIVIDAQGTAAIQITGISSRVRAASTGNAGSVEVDVTDGLSLLAGGFVASSTSGPGKGGNVRVSAGTLLVDGTDSNINARARAGSSGQSGNVSVSASKSITLSNGENSLSIRNDASVAHPEALIPTTLKVSAPDITLKNARITASSTGNVAASDIQIDFTGKLMLDPSSITTSANQGNGGAIRIQGGKLISLQNSQITTSVLGLTGNGGDILINADVLLLDTGFIQANTGAANARGGRVNLNLQNLVTSGNSLLVGGSVQNVFQPGVFGYNVIQAAAPSGLSGAVQITTPALDVSGSLSGLSAQVLDTGGLGRNPCQVTRGSSLAQTGHGGLSVSARGLLRVEPRLARVVGASTPTPGNQARVNLVNTGCS